MTGKERAYLRLVPPMREASIVTPARRLPPPKPRRPAAAVRKSLRDALARARELDPVDLAQCLPANPRMSGAAIARMVARHRFALDLIGELKVALRREADYRAWKRGQAYE
jgi:hypothetical protein